MRYKNIFIIVIAGFLILSYSCKRNKSSENYQKGTFGYDEAFLKKFNKDLICLTNNDSSSMVLICPAYQGRVMTSTANGSFGTSFGWINYNLIESGEIKKHMNPFGGEERFWLGPEGGQFSIFFEKGVPFEFENWNVPGFLDTLPFITKEVDREKATFICKTQFFNYAGTMFDIEIERTIKLLSFNDILNNLNVDTAGLQYVAFESANKLTNRNTFEWDKKTGMLSIWLLGMYNPSDSAVVAIPFIKGNEKELGQVVNDKYFGKVPADRLIVKDSVLFYKVDGKQRGKIGIPPKRAKKFSGSYDPIIGALTIVECSLYPGQTDYVNSLWEIQKEPFAGDAVNSYNDGPVADGSQLGPFYEIETSSPALNLQPNASAEYVQRTYHFKGNKAALDKIALELLGVTTDEIVIAFTK